MCELKSSMLSLSRQNELTQERLCHALGVIAGIPQFLFYLINLPGILQIVTQLML